MQSHQTSEDGTLPTMLLMCQLPKAEHKPCLDNGVLYSHFSPSDYTMHPGRNFFLALLLKNKNSFFSVCKKGYACGITIPFSKRCILLRAMVEARQECTAWMGRWLINMHTWDVSDYKSITMCSKWTQTQIHIVQCSVSLSFFFIKLDSSQVRGVHWDRDPAKCIQNVASTGVSEHLSIKLLGQTKREVFIHDKLTVPGFLPLFCPPCVFY